MKFRDVIFWIHLIAGIGVGAVILVMSVTGTILAFEPQIVSFAERNVRVVNKPEGDVQRLSLDALTAKAAEAQSGKKPSGVMIKSDPSSSVVVNFGKEGVTYINPYTGDILGGESKTHEFMHNVEVWHRWLGMEGKLKPVGHNIKGACNLVFLVLVITGFYLWWPKSWQWPGIKNIIVFNPQVKGKARDWNWHNVIGFWSAPFLMIIILTGVIMSYQWANNLLYRAAGSEPPPVRAKENMDSGPVKGNDRKAKSADSFKEEPVRKKSASLDVIFAQAEKQEPDWEAISIRLGQKADAPVTVMIRETASRYPSPQSTLTLDASTGDVKKWEPFSGKDLGRKWRVFARYIHTGQAVGFPGQIIACLASIAATVLIWTGFAMAWYRFNSWRKRKTEQKI